MDETAVVTCFLRNDAAVLLCRRSEAVGTYRGAWGAVAGHVEGDPDTAVRAEIREETGLDPDTDVSRVRRGEAFEVIDGDLDRRWIVHPFLFDCATRTVETNRETAEHAWLSPTAIRSLETVPGLWAAYDGVRPGVETVAGDRDHGSAYLSVRALEVLRDEATLATDGIRGDTRETDGWEKLRETAVALCEARPSMPVVRNRVDRVMDAASRSADVSAVEHAAAAGIADALDADVRAARRAAGRVRGARIATLSRSGTVRETLSRADPEAVLVAESRPGREGVAVAEELSVATDVTLASDAAFAHAVRTWDADAVLVGADAVDTDGAVHNKVGTRAAALAGTYEGIEVLVVAASDKITDVGEPALEPGEGRALYDGPTDLGVYDPTFDVTPADCVDAVVTEDGVLGRREVAAVADAHRRRARWRS
jgi:translation initiation factor 2B subunit (eIF-2B alpha/beta/delta family)/8-oxo-dGTP pyrophosphatase MutT (NUDIX family)